MGWPVTYVIESAAPTYQPVKVQVSPKVNTHSTQLRTFTTLKMRTHLIVYCIPLRHEHTINTAFFARPARRGAEVAQGAVELCQLVDGFVPYQRLADEYDLVWAVDGDELCETWV